MRRQGIWKAVCVLLSVLFIAGCDNNTGLEEEFLCEFVEDMVALEYRADADVKVQEYSDKLSDQVKAQLDALVEGTWREFNEVFEGDPPGANCTVVNFVENKGRDSDRYLIEAQFVSDTFKSRTVIVMAQVTVSNGVITDWRYECYDTNPTAFDPWAS